MQELLSLETAHFSFSIWGSGIQKRQDTYSEMLNKRVQEHIGRSVQVRFLLDQAVYIEAFKPVPTSE